MWVQEWKEQRAAKAQQLAGRPPTQPHGVKPGPVGRPASSRPAEKENAAGARHPPPAQQQQQQQQQQPAPAKAAPWDYGGRKPALPAGQKAALEQTFGALENRLQALKRESLRPSLSSASAAATAAAGAAAPPPAATAVPAPQPPAAAETAAALPVAQQPAGPAPHAAEPEPKAAAGGLAARLDALKRESVRPSFAGGPQPQFEAAGAMDMHQLSRLAHQLFNDDQFLQLCDKGMSSQLTRSKDGATEETKIMELAGGSQ